jgi:hypothetical protein
MPVILSEGRRSDRSRKIRSCLEINARARNSAALSHPIHDFVKRRHFERARLRAGAPGRTLLGAWESNALNPERFLFPTPYSLPGSPATGLCRWGGYSLPFYSLLPAGGPGDRSSSLGWPLPAFLFPVPCSLFPAFLTPTQKTQNSLQTKPPLHKCTVIQRARGPKRLSVWGR